MFIGFGVVTVLALTGLFVAIGQSERRRKASDPYMAGHDPQFASVRDEEWCELTLSTERARW